MRYFIPSKENIASLNANYYQEWLDGLSRHYNLPRTKLSSTNNKSYTDYNYAGEGIVVRIKTFHFEAALRYTKEYFNENNVIDFGCADGVFIPSLSKYYQHVFGIDVTPEFIDSAKILVEKAKLNNVMLYCNNDFKIESTLAAKPNKEYKIAYILEVLEHIGSSGETMYEEKRKVLLELTSLLTKDGVILVTVPKMVGISFLIQRFGLWLLRMGREPISFWNLMRSAFLKDASRMEKNWWPNYGHLGFNHLKMEQFLATDFEVLKRKELFFQVLYLLRKK